MHIYELEFKGMWILDNGTWRYGGKGAWGEGKDWKDENWMEICLLHLIGKRWIGKGMNILLLLLVFFEPSKMHGIERRRGKCLDFSFFTFSNKAWCMVFFFPLSFSSNQMEGSRNFRLPIFPFSLTHFVPP